MLKWPVSQVSTKLERQRHGPNLLFICVNYNIIFALRNLALTFIIYLIVLNVFEGSERKQKKGGILYGEIERAGKKTDWLSKP